MLQAEPDELETQKQIAAKPNSRLDAALRGAADPAALSPPPRRRRPVGVVAASVHLLGGGLGILVLPRGGRDRGGGVFGFGGRLGRRLFARDLQRPGFVGGRLRRRGAGAARVAGLRRPRRSLSQDSISRSSPRARLRAARCGGARRYVPVDGFGWAEKRVVGASFGSARPGAGIFVVPAADGASGAGGRKSGRGGGRSRSARPRRHHRRWDAWGRAVDGVAAWPAGGWWPPAGRTVPAATAACARRAGESRRAPTGSAGASSTSGPTSSRRRATSSPTAPGTSERRWRPAAAPPSGRTPDISSSPGRRTRTTRPPLPGPARPR